MDNEYNRLVAEVSDLLFRKWDPIGVSKFAPKDEYIDYARHIVHALRSKNEEYIFNYLRTSRSITMCLPKDDCCDRDTARVVFAVLAQE
jgi:hypothetical protein